jgi:hypothetical protein
MSATAESLLSGRSAKTGRHAIAQVLLQGFDPYTGESVRAYKYYTSCRAQGWYSSSSILACSC